MNNKEIVEILTNSFQNAKNNLNKKTLNFYDLYVHSKNKDKYIKALATYFAIIITNEIK